MRTLLVLCALAFGSATTFPSFAATKRQIEPGKSDMATAGARDRGTCNNKARAAGFKRSAIKAAVQRCMKGEAM